MKFIKIQNKGLLDVKLIPLMGGTTKKNDQFKIGQFGTGLKYALAFLVRNNIQFKIFVGANEVPITSTIEEIAGQTFTIIYINGERTSITAQMGLDWNHWMIIREIWCNALDEGGAERKVVDLLGIRESNLEENTTFYIEYNIEFAKIWQDWSKYFVQDFEPLYENSLYAIYPSSSKLKIYKQGVLIHEEDQNTRNSVFNYDIKNASINELREFRGSAGYEIYNCLASIKDKKIITYFLEKATEEHYESHIDTGWMAKLDDTWKEAIGDAQIIHQEAKENALSRGIKLDLSKLVTVPKNFYYSFTKYFEGIGALRMASKLNEFYEIFDTELDSKIKQGLVILEECGYFIHPELKFVYGVFGDKTTLAQINHDQKIIYISEMMKNQSLFSIVAMLIEENEHFNTGFQDESRSFQQHFINLFTKTLLDKHKVNI